MNVLVYVEAQDGVPDEDALGVLSKAAQLDGNVSAIVCGSKVRDLAPEVVRHGARRVLVVEHPSLADLVPSPRVEVLVQICRRDDIDVLLCPTTAVTCDMAAGLAARFEAGLAWGLTDVEVRDGSLFGKRLTYDDTILVEIGWTTKIKVGLFRPHALKPVVMDSGDPLIEYVSIDLEPQPNHPRFVDKTSFTDQDGPSLAAADVVVSGGRGIEKAENLGLIRELASALGGVPGVSLPLVEMGWAPRSMQVGQTGTVVKPRLYVACGISGQIQHRVGMENSGTIVAINKDPRAPIMSFCDLAVVAELQTVVPRLVELLRQRKEMRCRGM